ncbi:chromo domain-containing protein [Ophiostoma piceae UAMH 11346]|uniref:Chromo domain-containing protein n=1 Tax=Ophiostoma piceae (strain UAMH 11346) TaxID=1262450 RepID=S3BSE8_OPHP1|nr:chromo domain-containing protein [Ophiostoma piceae UAMH 11346]
MARPRRAQPAPSWASSSRMTKPIRSTSKRTKTNATSKANTNLQVVLYDRPRYVAGVSSVPSGPISLVPPRDCDAYIIDKVVTPFDGWGAQAATAEEYDTDEEDARYAADPARRTVQRVLNYVVGWPDEPYARELVPCTQILDYVSPYTLEAYEYELCERQRQRREKPHFMARETEKATKKKKKQTEKKKSEKWEKRTGEARAENSTGQQRDGDGKFLPKGSSTPSKTAASTQMSQMSQIKLDSPVASLGLSPSKQASLSQPVVSLSLSLSSLSSLSPNKQRMPQGLPQTQTTLSLKRPYDKFVDHVATTATATPTETETESVSVSVSEDSDEHSDEDELHVSLPRVTPIPLPTFAPVLSASSASKPTPTPTSASASTSTLPPLPRSTSSSSSSRKITRVSPPRVTGMRSEALTKRVKVEDAKEKPGRKDGKEEKVERKEKREIRVTPIPPPVYHKSKPKEQPPDEPEDPEEDLYEVDRLEGDCYTYVDDDADGAVPQDGMPVPKKLVQYFSVRWKGDWPPDQNPTWEPAENLPPRMVQQYLRKLDRQEQAQWQSPLASQLGQDHRHQREELLGLSSDNDDDASQDDVKPVVFSDI